MNKNLTSNIELLDILKNNNIKINGVFAKDKLKKPLKDGFSVVQKCPIPSV